MANSWGGKRTGSGLPKGFKFASTEEKLKARKLMETRILNRLNPLLNAQFTLAEGLQYVYKIVTTGEGKNQKRETVLVEDPDEIREFLDEHEGGNGVVGEDYYFITVKPPSDKAIDSMIDRVFGKATQSIELDNPTQNMELKKINDTLKGMFTNVKSRKAKAKN